MTDKKRGQGGPASIEVPKHGRSPQGGLVSTISTEHIEYRECDNLVNITGVDDWICKSRKSIFVTIFGRLLSSRRISYNCR